MLATFATAQEERVTPDADLATLRAALADAVDRPTAEKRRRAAEALAREHEDVEIRTWIAAMRGFADHAETQPGSRRLVVPLPVRNEVEETEIFVRALHQYGADGDDDQYGARFLRMYRVRDHHARLFPDAPEAERHAALLRLGVEESGVTEAELAARGHPARVWEILRITAAAPDEAPATRAARIAASGDPGAMRVALAELAEQAGRKRPAPRDAGTRAALERAAETLRSALARTPDP